MDHHTGKSFAASRRAISAVRDKGLGTARALGQIRDARLAARSQELDRLLQEHTATELGLAGAAALGPKLDALTVDDPG